MASGRRVGMGLALLGAVAAIAGCKQTANTGSQTLADLRSPDKSQHQNACATDETQKYLLSQIVNVGGTSKYNSQVQSGVSIKLSNIVLSSFDEATYKAVCGAQLTILYNAAVFNLLTSHGLDQSAVTADEQKTYDITYSMQPQVNSDKPNYIFDASNIGMVGAIISALDKSDADAAAAAATNQANAQAATPVPHLIAIQLQGVTANGGACAITGALTNASIKDVSFALSFNDAQSQAAYQLSVSAAANTSAASANLGQVTPAPAAGDETTSCPGVDSVKNAIVSALQSGSGVTACVSGTESFDDCRKNLRVAVH